MRSIGKEWGALVSLSAWYLGLALLFAGVARQPANDDFAFARAVQIGCETGRWHMVTIYGQLAPSSITHLAWGIFCCGWTGFAYETLHAANLILAWTGSLALYGSCRTLGSSRLSAWLLAANLSVSPFYLGHAFTFMTDQPAVSWAFLATFCSLRGWWHQYQGNTSHSARVWVWWSLAGLCATAAIATRQTSAIVLALPVGIALGKGWQDWRAAPNRLSLGWQVLCLLLGTVALPVIGWLLLEHGLGHQSTWERLVRMIQIPSTPEQKSTRQMILNFYGGMLILGFFLVPILPWLLYNLYCSFNVNRGRWWHCLGAMPGLACLCLFTLYQGRLMITNSTGYFLQNAHLGPILLSDQNIHWGDMGGVVWPTLVWQSLSVLSLLALIALGITACQNLHLSSLSTLIRSTATRSDTPLAVTWPGFVLGGFLLLALLFGVVFFVGTIKVLFDRYWMTLLTPLYLWVGLWEARNQFALANHPNSREPSRLWNQWAWIGTALLFVIMAVGTVILIHDYLHWNQARWQVVQRWEKKGLQPSQFDGGYEVNGWFRAASDPNTLRWPDDAPGFCWVPSKPIRALAIGPRPGFQIIDREPWFSWATGRWHEILELAPETAQPTPEEQQPREIEKPGLGNILNE